MKSAPNHLDEAHRVAVLHRLRLLDTEPEERFDRITRLVAAVLDVPIALITLVDDDRQWFKSRAGLEVSETSRDVSFCAHAIVRPTDRPFVIEDTLLDERFSDNPFVLGAPGVRFYAGQVVRDTTGLPMGTLCAIDRRPRTLDERGRQALGDLARLVEQELARHRDVSVLDDLDRSERRKALIFDTMSEGLVYQDADGRILNWNRAAERLLGLSAEELDGRKSVDPRWRAIREDGSPWPGETHPAMEALQTGRPVKDAVMGVYRPEDERVWLRVNANPVLDRSGKATSVLAAFADITVEHELMVEQRRFSYLFRNATDIITVIDRDGRMSYTSPSAERVLGFDLTSLTGATIWQILHPDDHGVMRTTLQNLLASSSDGEPFVLRVQTHDGHWRHLEFVAVNLLREPAVDGIVLTARDVTERHRAAEALVYSATHDELTDLPNRRRLSALIAASLQRAANEDRHIALCFVDLDRFKAVNDTFGHGVGDRLLVGAAQAIRRTARPGDHAARVGGDEFVVVLDPIVNEAEALDIARRITEAIADQRVPGLPADRANASVGVAISQPGDSPSSLLQRADAALYRAKIARQHAGPADVAEAIYSRESETRPTASWSSN